MIKCIHCGRENEEIFIYCLGCGKELEKSLPSWKPAEKKKTTSTKGVLEIINADGTVNHTFELHQGINTVGSESCDITIPNDPYLSPLHMKLLVEDEEYYIEDAKTLNGVFIRIKEEIPLADGDFFRLGQSLFLYESIAVKKKDNPQKAGTPLPGDAFGIIRRVVDKDKYISANLLRGDSVEIGRSKGKLNFMDDKFISGLHAVIFRRDNAVFLKDVGSVNGTYVRIKSRTPIRNGDSILIGKNLFRFRNE